MGNIVLDSNYDLEYGTGTTKPLYQLTHPIGEFYQGGYVIYTWDKGSHGIIASPVSVGKIYVGQESWGCPSTSISGTLSTIGSGRNNTNLMISGCPTSSAACACTGYTGGGYTDWFLPSYEESLEVMQQHTILGLLDDYFWTSYQYDSTNAFVTYWHPTPNGGYGLKTDVCSVRACRYF